jgi:predicted amidohydrolase
MFKLALIQMLVEAGRKRQNLDRALRLIDQAAGMGAAVVLLPEAMNLGWTHPSARTEAEAIPQGESCVALCAAAKKHQIYLCAGIVERAAGQVYNSAVLIDPGGRVILLHRKLNELGIGHDLYAQGDRLGVAHTSLGTIGVMLCADAFARGQVVSRTLGLMGADIILSPSAWAVPADHENQKEPYGGLWLENYGPVARDFRLWIAGVSNVGWINEGPWQGRKCIGCSLLVGPTGAKVLEGPYGHEAETILYADIKLEPRPARGDDWEHHWKDTPLSVTPAESQIPETGLTHGKARNDQTVDRPTAR